MIHIALYFVAVVAANVVVTLIGPAATIWVAFLFVGATLTLRDRVHDKYGRAGAVATVSGGCASAWLVLTGFGQSGNIAAASLIAFLVSEALDTVVYHTLRGHSWYTRSNGSNLTGAAADSLLFPVLAFGGFPVAIILGQFAAKALGGALWSVLLRNARRGALAAALVVGALLLNPSTAEAQKAGPPRFVVQAQVGTMHYPWKGYDKPVGNYGINALVFLPRGFSFLAVVSRDAVPGAQWVGVAALQYRLFAR